MSVYPWITAAVAYLLAVAASDRAAHNMLYPLIGFGHPLKGRWRWLLRISSPAVLAGLSVAGAVAFLWVVFAMQNIGQKR
jgi:hypothetical protein